MQAAELIADLEKGLAAAKELAASEQGSTVNELTVGPDGSQEPDTSQMPGGVDSAPVSAPEPEPVHEPTDAELQKAFAPVEHAAETEGLDILDKLKDGASVKKIADLFHDMESHGVVESLIKAISDVAQGVRI